MMKGSHRTDGKPAGAIEGLSLLTDGDVREALEMMKEAGEFGEGEEADQMVEQILKMMEQSGLVDSEGKVKRLSEKGLRLLSEKTLEELLSPQSRKVTRHP